MSFRFRRLRTPSTPYTNNDGASPFGGLVLSGSILHGTAASGGGAGFGTIFAVGTDGTGFRNLKNFSGLDGGYPEAGLVLSNNTMYGTTRANTTITPVPGQGFGNPSYGAVYAVNTDGSGFSLLHISEACQKYHVAVSKFKDGRRNGQHFECSDFMAFDFDDETTSQKIHEDCVRKNWRHIIMASKNHLRDKEDGKGIRERFHLFLMYRSDTKEEYKYAAKRISQIMGWTIDRNCTDATRYFYRHPKALFVWSNGEPIRKDWMQRLQNLEREIAERERQPG